MKLGGFAACILGVFGLLAACSSSDDTTPGGDSGTAMGAAAAHCKAVPEADSFCTCEIATVTAAEEIPTCDSTTSPNVACCLVPGSTGAGGGKGLCGCKQIACSEFSDGSCTCRTGDASTEKPVETCSAPDEGHCCKAKESSYCTCSASPCFDGDEEVSSCSPTEMVKTACNAGETKVDDCKTALK